MKHLATGTFALERNEYAHDDQLDYTNVVVFAVYLKSMSMINGIIVQNHASRRPSTDHPHE